MMPTWRKNYLRYKSFFLNIFKQYQQRPDVKVYLEIVLSSVAISIFAIFALRPTLLTISKLIKEVGAKQQTLAAMEEKIKNTKEAEDLYRNELDKIKLLDTAMPQEPSPDTLFRQLDGASKKNSVVITNFSISTLTLKDKSLPTTSVSSSAKPSSLKLSFNTRGVYKTVIGFLKDVENTRRPIIFSTFTLGSYIDKDLGKLIVLSVEGESPYVETAK
jgi:hypothetical protein